MRKSNCGGAIFPVLMGYASDAVQAQWGAILAMSVGILYLLAYWAFSSPNRD